jgi:hypothetical protein
MTVFGEDEDEIADPCVSDFFNGQVHTTTLEADTLHGRISPHEEGGITQNASGIFRFEGLRDMPSQGTEARCRLGTNCE